MAGVPSLSNAEADFGARSMLLSIRSLAKNLRGVPGRKMLILFTAGFPLSTENLTELTATIDACNKANVAIYPLDVRGLVTGMPGGSARLSTPGKGGNSTAVAAKTVNQNDAPVCCWLATALARCWIPRSPGAAVVAARVAAVAGGGHGVAAPAGARWYRRDRGHRWQAEPEVPAERRHRWRQGWNGRHRRHRWWQRRNRWNGGTGGGGTRSVGIRIRIITTTP